MKIKEPLFVLGAQRSGTTLLIKILSKNSRVRFLQKETHIYPLFWKNGNNFDFDSNDDLARFIEKAFPRANNGWTQPKNKEYLDKYINGIRLRKPTFSSAGELMEYSLLYHASIVGNGEKILGEKTPSHIYYYQQILKQFPNAKFLIPVRDPRACALSEKIKLNNNARINRNFKILNFATRWETANQLAIKMVRTLGTEKVHIVKYEELVQNPETIIRQLCSFLDIDFIPEMLDMEVVNSSFKDDRQKGKAFNTENLNRWKENLSANEIAQIEALVSDTMQHYGYEKLSPIKVKIKLKNLLKFKAARVATDVAPASFHHMVRHEKYKSI